MVSPLITASNLSFSYDHEVVLDSVSFEINAGDFVGIIGPNGSGKTTLLKLLLGILNPSSGSISILSKNVTAGKHAQLIGYIPQKVTQAETKFPITVEEVVSLGRIHQHGLFHRLGAADKKAVHKALKVVDLYDQRNALISTLSGGQQQRAFIAKALAGDPKVLVLDEPTVGIDLKSQETFYKLLATLHKDHGLTIIIVSHDIDVVINEVSSVLCLNKTLIYHGNPKTFIKEEYLEKLYGRDRTFIIHGH